jgi:hypothetical protein
MRTCSHIRLLLLLFGLTTQAQSQDSLCAFRWSWSNGDVVADIRVPIGYRIASSREYGEGMVTTLVWRDSSTILLHVGGVMTLPLLERTTHTIEDSLAVPHGYSERGSGTVGDLFWREDALYGGWYNIAYESVRSRRRVLFDNSLRSFVPRSVPQAVH